MRNGHVYLEVSERDANGVVVAKASAAIWASTASRILPEFERATGAQISPGIKLLVRAKPVFKPQYGFSSHRKFDPRKAASTLLTNQQDSTLASRKRAQGPQRRGAKSTAVAAGQPAWDELRY